MSKVVSKSPIIENKAKGNKDLLIGILNGVAGDFLVKENNELAIPMGFKWKNKYIKIESESLKEQLPDAKSKICILVHGLCADESLWAFPEKPEFDYGSLLKKDLEYTPFYLRYNSGLRISKNGSEFGDLIEKLIQNYPVKLKEIIIVAHSMGGLVSRSAAYYASLRKYKWPGLVKSMFFLGSPHQGAPLEKFGNILTNALDLIPRIYTKKIAEVINTRSEGIKDLRYGNLIEEDWKDYDPDEFLKNRKTNIPLLKGAEHFIINGLVSEKTKSIVNLWFGDIMVRKDSAMGQSSKDDLSIPFSMENHKEFPGINHANLCHNKFIYKQLKEWLGRDKS